MMKSVSMALCAALCLTASVGLAEVEGATYYTESANGYNGKVSVTIGVKDGQIVDVTAEGPGETDGIGSKAVAEMPAQILAAQSWDVDGVSGATYSSTGLRSAARACMVDAGLAEAEAQEEEAPRVEGADYFKAAANGFMGEVDVTIGVKDGQIVDVIAKGDAETKGVGTQALEALPAEILEAQNWDVDGVSGATFTSRAVKNAAKLAMIDAGLIPEE